MGLHIICEVFEAAKHKSTFGSGVDLWSQDQRLTCAKEPMDLNRQNQTENLR